MANIYLHFRDNRTKLFHEIAKALKSRNIADNIGASVVGRDGYEFLCKQDEIEYNPLILEADLRQKFGSKEYSEDRLKHLEKEYGTPSLNFYSTVASRFNDKSEEKQKALVQHWFDFYINEFSKFKPDLFLTDDVGHLSKVIPFNLTKIDYGNSAWWHTTRIQNYYAFSTSAFDQFDEIARLYSDIKDGNKHTDDYKSSKSKAVEHIKEFRKNGIKPQYSIDNNKATDTSAIDKIKTGTSHLIDSYVYNYKNDYMKESVLSLYKSFIIKLYRLYRNNSRQFFDSPVEEKYLFFPLHVQPEWSTLILAQPFINQILAVRQIANNLPIGYKLYVKDHPQMFGSRPITYYKKLKTIPDVRVLDPRLDSYTIIKDSELVTTITGTAGLEAALLNVPSIVFGNPYYSTLSSVEKIVNLYNIENIIYDNLQKPPTNEKDIVQFLTAIFEKGFKSRYPSRIPERQTTEEAEKIIDNLISFSPISNTFGY